MKHIIRLTENDLHRIVRESVNRILKEGHFMGPDADLYDMYPYMCGNYPKYDENGDEIDYSDDGKEDKYGNPL